MSVREQDRLIESQQGYGGGVIVFHDESSAGSAPSKAWTGAGTFHHHPMVERFRGNRIDRIEPAFSVDGNPLKVSFSQA